MRGFVHFNLKTFVWSGTPSALDIGSEPRILLDREGIAGQVCGFQHKTVGQCPLPALQALAGKPIHQVEIDVSESGRSGLSHCRDSLMDGAGPSDPRKVAIFHRFSAETHAGDACLKQLSEILHGNRGGVRFNGDFTVGGEGEMRANLRQDRGQLSRGKRLSVCRLRNRRTGWDGLRLRVAAPTV